MSNQPETEKVEEAADDDNASDDNAETGSESEDVVAEVQQQQESQQQAAPAPSPSRPVPRSDPLSLLLASYAFPVGERVRDEGADDEEVDRSGARSESLGGGGVFVLRPDTADVIRDVPLAESVFLPLYAALGVSVLLLSFMAGALGLHDQMLERLGFGGLNGTADLAERVTTALRGSDTSVLGLRSLGWPQTLQGFGLMWLAGHAVIYASHKIHSVCASLFDAATDDQAEPHAHSD